MSHKHETTVNIGDINCLHWNWCFPGDRFKIRYSFLVKFAPMIAPNFSRMRVKSEVFYVPASDLFPNFHEVMMNYKEEVQQIVENGKQTNVDNTVLPSMALNRFAWWFHSPKDSSVPTSHDMFVIFARHDKFQEYAVARLIHQMGIPFDITYENFPIGSETNPFANNTSYLDVRSSSGSISYFNPSGNVPISLLPFQAYQYVYNWFYRDSVRSYEIDTYPNVYDAGSMIGMLCSTSPTITLDYMIKSEANNSAVNRFMNSLFQVRRRFYRKDYFNTAVSDPTVGVESLSVPENIVDLRKVNQLQKFIEKRALTGDRVAEWIASHWAVKPDSYEVGKPILISSSSQNVQISEVLQTSESTSDSAQGTRSGNANSYGNSHGSFFVSPDYGILLINMTIVPEISYFSGVPRKFAVRRWEHLAFPEFAQIGMQPIYDFELSGFHDSDSTTWFTDFPQLEDLSVFGYSPRYSEFKCELDQISGELSTSLRFWHQSPAFGSKPGLNKDFGTIGFFDYNELSAPNLDSYQATTYYNQIFAVQDDRISDHCQVIGMFDITVNRALPANDMPAL